jgi:hypothetical protein
MIAMVLFLGTTSPARADEDERAIGAITLETTSTDPLPIARPTQKQWLVLIAIDDYENNEFLDDLKSCKRDAEALRDLLIERFGYQTENVIELFDKQATSKRIRNTIFALAEQTAPEDSVIISYSGHGYYNDQNQMGFWYSYDAENRWDGIANSLVKDWCRSFRARKVLVIADSCFSGSLLVRSSFARDTTKRSRELLAGGGLQPVADAGSPDGKHSVFNHYLRQGLEDLANKGEPFVTNNLYVELYNPVIANSQQEPQKGVIMDALHEGGQFLFYPVAASRPTPVPTATPEPIVVPEFSTDYLVGLANKRREQREAAEKAYKACQAQDAEEYLEAAEKGAMWQEYITKFESARYELAAARERLEHWQALANAPTPSPFPTLPPAQTQAPVNPLSQKDKPMLMHPDDLFGFNSGTSAPPATPMATTQAPAPQGYSGMWNAVLDDAEVDKFMERVVTQEQRVMYGATPQQIRAMIQTMKSNGTWDYQRSLHQQNLSMLYVQINQPQWQGATYTIGIAGLGNATQTQQLMYPFSVEGSLVGNELRCESMMGYASTTFRFNRKSEDRMTMRFEVRNDAQFPAPIVYDFVLEPTTLPDYGQTDDTLDSFDSGNKQFWNW